MVVRLVTPGGFRPHLAKVVASGVSGAVNGVVIASDRDALVATVAEAPAGIVVDDVPTDLPPKFLRLAVSGDVIFDSALTSQTIGVPVWSDGDGTYSVTKPVAGAADTQRWMLGIITDSDATGSVIELNFTINTDGAT